jgi:hypothetical protein
MPIEVKSQEVITENDQVVVTKTVEERMTKYDLLNKKEDIRKQKEMLVMQSRDTKKRFDELVIQEQELDSMIAMLPDEEPTTI